MAAPSDQGQRLSREVNLRIREVTGRFPANGPIEFLCECGREDCAVTIELTEEQWDGLAGDRDFVLVTAEHAQ